MYISKFDLHKGFWLIPLTEECRKFTAFQVPGCGLFEYTRLMFGLKTSPPIFQRLIDTVLGADLDQFVKRYIDDIIICTESFGEHTKIVTEVLRRLRVAQLSVNWEKSEFGASQVKYLGYFVDKNGLRLDSEKVKPILDYPAPKNVRQLRRVLGMMAWFKRFIPNFSKEMQPMTRLPRKKTK